MTAAAEDLAGRLGAFATDWRRLTREETPADRLLKLVPKLRGLLRAAETPTSRQTITGVAVRDLTQRLKEPLRAARTAGTLINPTTVAGLKRREVPNAAVLATLWSPAQGGATAIRFLAEFLRRVESRGRSLPTLADLEAGYTVRVECCPEGDETDRVDLVIETGQHVLGIEMKIGASEGAGQLSRYLLAVGRNAADRRKEPVLILLARAAPSRDDVLSASWAIVRAAAAAAVPRRLRDRSFNDHLVAAFGRHVANF